MPHPASRRRSITRPVVIAVLATTALTSWLAAVPGTAGVEPSDSRNLLDHPIVDLALLDAAGPDGAPRLLVVDAVQRAPGVGGPAQGYATADGAFTEMEDLPPGGGLV